MKHSPLSFSLLVAVILLTFSVEKVFCMGGFWSKPIDSDPLNSEAKPRSQEGRAEEEGGDPSGALSRGVLGLGTDPSEQQEVTAGSEVSKAAFDGTVGAEEKQDRKQRSYHYGNMLSAQQQAYLHLQDVQEKCKEARRAFIQAGRLDGTRNAYSMTLDVAQLQIDQLTKILQKAEQKTPAERAPAFEGALQYIKDKSLELCSVLDSAIEDATVAHEREQLRIYNAFTWEKSFTSIENKAEQAAGTQIRTKKPN